MKRTEVGPRAKSWFSLTGSLLLLALPQSTRADDSTLVFQDIAADNGSELSTYRRVPSPRRHFYDLMTAKGTMTFFDMLAVPANSGGAPGLALFDFDGDGDLDIYATNGPGVNNSLFVNQLSETGETIFIDLGEAAGVGAPDHDSSGVCYGDTDNDGDHDLLVLGQPGTPRFFENNGDGTFTDISQTTSLNGGIRRSASCSFGDVNGDGLLDVAIANCCVTMDNLIPIMGEPFALSEKNQLFLNEGGNRFADISETSGFTDLKGMGDGNDGQPTVTWAISMVDYDLDGDIDILHADDQAGQPSANQNGFDRGILHLLRNDGSGHFSDVTAEAGLNITGAWMGLSFGDINGDGHLDFFATNGGDWGPTIVTPLDPVYGAFFKYEVGEAASRWFLGSSAGTFADPGVGSLVATPVGWGTSMHDYDNDADTDILFHGGLDVGLFIQGAPGALLRNDGVGNFQRDSEALRRSTDHETRDVQGVAVGDLNNDGFTDFVSVSSLDTPNGASLARYNHHWGSDFDGGHYSQTFVPTSVPGVFAFSGIEYDMGTLSVELSSGDNGNGWVKVRALGSVDLTTHGHVNRDGIGAVIQVTETRTGKRTMMPVLGGASYASQDSLEITFGLGQARSAQVDVIWPGGVKNRLYNVHPGIRILFPEIPCSFDAGWSSTEEYVTCVNKGLDEILQAGAIDHDQKGRFLSSAIRAFHSER